ncbi:splicing factor, proline- and glutamine-rich-like isoform X2 [Xenia sp. Carnegie-2017]|uniref:splicing factor, proline- and glutamine-rich-like isoform X2 n=1 Tax=Xenia sp. Carnegie-2017 TaxID=2897299 RepID=UPI001F042DAE|nr:splicing factor, proline- and glutamine-rich-like isoform X2 [Xenia sp. Carnegie-2017]
MSSSNSRNRSRSPLRKPNESMNTSSDTINREAVEKDKQRSMKPHVVPEKEAVNSEAAVNSNNQHNTSGNDSSLDSNTLKHNSAQKISYVSTNSKTYVNPVTGKTERKFSNRCRLFIGNIADMKEEEFKKMFEKYGEYTEAYLNKEKAFGFIKMDTRMAAEAAKNALDGSMRKGRNLTVRFASLSTAIHVSNLGPLVSNEMLEKAFSIFGDVERAVVVVDDRGRSKGYGRVEFARKGNATSALQKTSENFFMIGRSPRPVFTKQQEQTDWEDGLLEKSVERMPMYSSERDAGGRFAPAGTFEHEWCKKWKELDELKRTQFEALENEFKEAEEKLELDMAQAVTDYEAEIKHRELMVQQAELHRKEEMMRQEMIRRQAMEMRRHDEARLREDMRRREEIRIQEDILRRQQDELFRRQQLEEAAILHRPRAPLPHGIGLRQPVPPMFLRPGLTPVHNLSPRVPIPFAPRIPLSPEVRFRGMMGYEIDGDRGRRSMDRGDRSGSRYLDHKPRDRY